MEGVDEKKNQRKGLYISLGLHAVVMLIFFFLLAWKEPFPPIPEYGIELNFGLDNQGSGAVQRQAPVTPVTTENDNATSESTEAEETEEAEEAPEEVESEETALNEVETTDTPSPDVVEETDTNDTGVNAEVNTEETPETATNESETEPIVEPSEESVTGGINQGDDENKVGDEGDPEGELDERALYGNPGAGGGASLDMAGWMWDEIPKPNDQSDENGRIVFSITIDDEGEILSIKTIQKTVTPAVERIYRAEIERLTFSTTGSNNSPAPTSTGTITFIIKSN